MDSTGLPFEGVVLRRDPDGYGFVRFSQPESLRDQTGVFTRDVFADPAVSSVAAESRVTGTARRFRDGFKIVRLVPLHMSE